MSRANWLFTWLVLLIGVSFWTAQQLQKESTLRSDILSLLPAEGQQSTTAIALEHLTHSEGNRAFILVTSNNLTEAIQATVATDSALSHSGVFNRVISQVPNPQLTRIINFYKTSAPTLYSPKAKADLNQAFISRTYNSVPSANLFRTADDPFGNATEWVKSLPWPQANLQWHEGYLTSSVAESSSVLIMLELPEKSADYLTQVAVISAINQAEASIQKKHPHTRFQRLGGIFYAEAAQTGARHDMDYISIGSAIGVILIMLLIFRSVSMIAVGVISIVSGVIAGTAAVLLTFGQIHLITIVFGVSLIGEAADYTIQLLSAKLADTESNQKSYLQRMVPGLCMALGTSLLGYAAMTLVPLPSIKQIAVFALTGLSAAFITVIIIGPLISNLIPTGKVSAGFEQLAQKIRALSKVFGQRSIITATIILIIGTILSLGVRIDDDIRSLVNRPVDLVTQEEYVKKALGANISTQFILIHPKAGTDESCLIAEEELKTKLESCKSHGLLTGWTALSDVVPSEQKQLSSLESYREALSHDRSRLEATFNEIGFNPAPGFWEAKANPVNLTDFLELKESTPFQHLRLSNAGKVMHVITLQGVKDSSAIRLTLPAADDISYVDKIGSISQLLGDIRRQAITWILLAFTLALAVLSLRYGPKRSLLLLLPTALGVAWAPYLASLTGAPLSVFTLMALMLVLGVGVNYSIFLWEGGTNSKSALAGVIASCLTTLLSFGLLGFCSMPALSWLGLTLTFGILVSFLLTPLALTNSPE